MITPSKVQSWINIKQGKVIAPRVLGTNNVLLLPNGVEIDTLSVNINGLEMQLGLDYDIRGSLIIFNIILNEYSVARLSWVAK